MNPSKLRIARMLALACAFVAACSSDTVPLDRIASDDWSDATASMKVTDTGAIIFMVCELDTIPGALTLDADGNFAHPGRAAIGINVFGRPSHPAVFTGHATSDAVTITRSVPDGTGLPPVTHDFTKGVKPFTPCP